MILLLTVIILIGVFFAAAGVLFVIYRNNDNDKDNASQATTADTPTGAGTGNSQTTTQSTGDILTGAGTGNYQTTTQSTGDTLTQTSPIDPDSPETNIEDILIPSAVITDIPVPPTAEYPDVYLWGLTDFDLSNLNIDDRLDLKRLPGYIENDPVTFPGDHGDVSNTFGVNVSDATYVVGSPLSQGAMAPNISFYSPTTSDEVFSFKTNTWSAASRYMWISGPNISGISVAYRGVPGNITVVVGDTVVDGSEYLIDNLIGTDYTFIRVRTELGDSVSKIGVFFESPVDIGETFVLLSRIGITQTALLDKDDFYTDVSSFSNQVVTPFYTRIGGTETTYGIEDESGEVYESFRLVTNNISYPHTEIFDMINENIYTLPENVENGDGFYDLLPDNVLTICENNIVGILVYCYDTDINQLKNIRIKYGDLNKSYGVVRGSDHAFSNAVDSQTVSISFDRYVEEVSISITEGTLKIGVISVLTEP